MTLKEQRLENYDIMFMHKNDEYSSFKNCLEMKIVERDGVWPRVVYMAFRFPILLSDREFLFRLKRN